MLNQPQAVLDIQPPWLERQAESSLEWATDNIADQWYTQPSSSYEFIHNNAGGPNMVPQTATPFLTREEMREVDRAMVKDFRIDLVQMMENAGRHLAQLARTRFFAGDPRGRQVLVLVGSGGNGGGALAGARRLGSWGADVRVRLTAPEAHLASATAHQLESLRCMGLSIELPPVAPGSFTALSPPLQREAAVAWFPDLIVDGIIGYSLQGAPRGDAAELIRSANAADTPILSLDLPSGLDADLGAVAEPIIRASATLTLALPKVGLRAAEAREFAGELYLADIGVPPALYERPPLGLQVGPLFARDEILRLW